MRAALAILLVASVAAVSTSAATAAPARTERLTPAEQKWVTPMVKVWNDMNTRLQKVQSQLAAENALIVGTEPNRIVTLTLAAFFDCGTFLKRAGKVPARLAPVNVSMTAACARFKAGALSIADGIGQIRKAKTKVGVARITEGLGELKQGSNKLVQAKNRLTTISAKNPNAR